LRELSETLGRLATLDDIPDAELDRLAARGFDWIWLLSVWRTGPAGQRISRTNAEWRREFGETLPDLHEDDIGGSGFAITGYIVADRLGGDAALGRLRERLRVRGLRLLLDFVPNHTGLDHPWVEEVQHFYDRLLAVLRQPVVRDGQWQLLECAPAWEGNWTSDCFMASAWQGPDETRLLVAVNYAPNQSQCFVRMPFTDLDGRQWRLEDRMQGTFYERDGCDLQRRGLYLDVRPWQASVFTLTRNQSES
jgi:hypothetical protein